MPQLFENFAAGLAQGVQSGVNTALSLQQAGINNSFRDRQITLAENEQRARQAEYDRQIQQAQVRADADADWLNRYYQSEPGQRAAVHATNPGMLDEDAAARRLADRMEGFASAGPMGQSLAMITGIAMETSASLAEADAYADRIVRTASAIQDDGARQYYIERELAHHGGQRAQKDVELAARRLSQMRDQGAFATMMGETGEMGTAPEIAERIDVAIQGLREGLQVGSTFQDFQSVRGATLAVLQEFGKASDLASTQRAELNALQGDLSRADRIAQGLESEGVPSWRVREFQEKLRGTDAKGRQRLWQEFSIFGDKADEEMHLNPEYGAGTSRALGAMQQPLSPAGPEAQGQAAPATGGAAAPRVKASFEDVESELVKRGLQPRTDTKTSRARRQLQQAPEPMSPEREQFRGELKAAIAEAREGDQVALRALMKNALSSEDALIVEVARQLRGSWSADPSLQEAESLVDRLLLDAQVEDLAATYKDGSGARGLRGIR